MSRGIAVTMVLFALLLLGAASWVAARPSGDVRLSALERARSPVITDATPEPRAHLPRVARDGKAPPPPTPTPTPTPEPRPGALGRCMEPRGAGSNARPAGENSLLRNCQVIAYYGHPNVPAMGILGIADRAGMIARLESQAAAFDPLNGPRGVVTAFHLIVGVAHPSAYGSALSHMSADAVDEWVALAEARDALLILDTQVGHNSVESEVERLLPYLENPRVHLALDPEWTMPQGYVPGQIIGWMHARDINRAQQMLQSLVDEHGLPNKLLVVHQFTPDMIRNKHLLEDYPGVDLVIDMDGWGPPGLKISQYNRFVRDDDAEHAGIKLYFDREPNLMPPADINALRPEPDIVIYQ